MWSVHVHMYLEIENVLAQDKIATRGFLKWWENARKQTWTFHEKEATQVLNCGADCDMSVDLSISQLIWNVSIYKI